MSGPQDPRQWQPQGGDYPSDATQAGSPWQQQPSQDATWHAPAYTPTELNLPRASQVSVPLRRASEVTAPDTSLQIRRVSENARPYESPKLAPSHSF